MAIMNLKDYLAANKPKGFKAQPYYSKLGDFLTYYFEDSDSVAHRVDEVLTVYHHRESGELIGFKLKGIKVLHRELGDFNVNVHDGDGTLRLSLYIWARLEKVNPDTLIEYQRIAKMVKNVTLDHQLVNQLAA